MNLIKFFIPVLTELERCQVVASNHKMCRNIPNDNLHCYPGAWDCMQKLLSFQKPTQSEAEDLTRFIMRVSRIDTLDGQEITGYFDRVHGYKITLEML